MPFILASTHIDDDILTTGTIDAIIRAIGVRREALLTAPLQPVPFVQTTKAASAITTGRWTVLGADAQVRTPITSV